MSVQTQLTPLQVCAAMSVAGWPSSEFATGAAVAFAESDDIATAQNPSGAKGLFQILQPAHQDLFQALSSPLAWEDPIVNAKMALAVWRGRGAIWDVGGWASYGNSKYQGALPAARLAAAQLTQLLAQSVAPQKDLGTILEPVSPMMQGLIAWETGVTQAIGGTVATAAGGIAGTTVAAGAAVNSAVQTTPLSWLSNVGDFFSRLGQANTWLRIGEFLLGAGLVVVGLAHLMGDTSAGRAVKKIATKAALV